MATLTTSRCRSCRRPIRWERTVAGKSIPLDTFPNDAGNVILENDHCRVLGPAAADAARAESAQLWMPHMGSCPKRR